MDILLEGKRVFDVEIDALIKTRDALNEAFINILELITSCEGKIIITGIGKPGHIATKLAATFSSLGTPAFYMNPAEAMHGDLGMISATDVVMAISYSGESNEILTIIPPIKLIGAKLIGITGNINSTLAKEADLIQVLPKFEEACYLGLAPTSSTTAELVYGDALAVVASGIYGFKNADFGKFHPAGSLGKKLILRVNDLMIQGDLNPIIVEDAVMKEAIVAISKSGIGMTSVVSDDGIIKGIITDGDLRRSLERGADIYSLKASDVMSKNPVVVETETLAVKALSIMKNKGISCLAVVKNGRPIGGIKMQDIISAGIVDSQIKLDGI